jgi:hypothetical protein
LSLSKEQTRCRGGAGKRRRRRKPRRRELRKRKRKEAHTSLRDIGVLSSSGRCCSKAKTMQLAMMVARIMYSKGVRKEELRNKFT